MVRDGFSKPNADGWSAKNQGKCRVCSPTARRYSIFEFPKWDAVSECDGEMPFSALLAKRLVRRYFRPERWSLNAGTQKPGNNMSWLLLVRHAQASFHADDYDQLSPLGQRQACLLGEEWVQRGLVLDEVYVGPRSRQQQTAEAVAACYERAGLSFPKVEVLQELDEYDLRGILEQLAPVLARQDAEFGKLFTAQRQGATSRDQKRSFQTMFEPLLRRWQAAVDSPDEMESWKEFSQRVACGLRRVTQQPGPSRRVAAFTSGGFIGTAVQSVLGAPDVAALEINWRIRNAAVTEFVFSGDRITLDSFNNAAHLTEPEMMTYR